jgi:F-type H+-transporting ATPase subunit gamma
MEKLTRLNARLSTLSELREIIIALRSMAASAAREGAASLPAIRRYGKTIGEGLADTAAIYGLETIPKESAEGPGLMCLIGSEHGFVGDLNRRLVEHAGALGQEWQLLFVGRKLAGAAEEVGMTVDDVIPMTSHVASVPLVARRIADRAVAFDRVSVTVAIRYSKEGLKIEERRILPIPPEAFGKAAAEPPLHHLSAAELLSQIAEEYLLAQLAEAVMEGLAGINEVRLRVLTAADTNIGDKIDSLTQQARSLRQEEITAELLDIVTGAEAIAGEG